MIDKIFEPKWAEQLSAQYSSDKFALLGQKIAGLRNKTTVYPAKDRVFRAFEETPYDEVKVVVVGQDPYNDGSADGLAFSASLNSSKCPPSLGLILKEIERSFPEEVQELHSGKIDPWDLARWTQQGVFLTNTSYTVEKNKPASHTIYWKSFFKAVVKALNQKQDLVWLLLGAEARNFKPLISNPSHAIVETVHPAADLYSGESRFYGSDCFKSVNKELEARNKKRIVW